MNHNRHAARAQRLYPPTALQLQRFLADEATDEFELMPAIDCMADFTRSIRRPNVGSDYGPKRLGQFLTSIDCETAQAALSCSLVSVL